MSIIYFCLNKAIFLIVVKLIIVLFSFNTASASSCESTSENNFDVVVVFNESDIDSICKSAPFSISSDREITEFEEPSARKEISESDVEEELVMKEEKKNELLNILSSRTRYTKHSELLESHIFKYVKNLLYPDFLKKEKDNPEYKYIVLFPESEETSLFDKSGGTESLTTYQLNSDIVRNDIISANLWLFTGNERVAMSIREVEKFKFNAKTRSVIIDELWVTREKWYKISMTSTVKTWLPNHMNIIEISCEYCYSRITPGGTPYFLLPFIALEMKTSYKYADAIPARNEKNWVIKTFEICRRPITIDFKSIGWNEWIVYPERFNTNYCKGSYLSNFDNYCSHPIASKEKSNVDIYHWKTPPAICCLPIRYSTLEIGYMIAPFIAVFTTLPNMTLEECGCSWSPDI